MVIWYIKKGDIMEKVRVIRHFRFMDKKTSELKSRGGVTFVFEMDYDKRLVDVFFSICSPNDNFCKSDGIRYAIEQGSERTMLLDPFQTLADSDRVSGGFVSAYFNILVSCAVMATISDRELLLMKKINQENKRGS